MVLDNLQGFATVDEKGEKELSKLKAFQIVSIKITDHRNLDQNALLHKWFGIIAKETHDTPEAVKCYCKHEYGVPVLRAEDPEFNSFYRAVIADLNYEQRLKTMKYISVTSRASVKQLAKITDHIQKAYAVEGIILKSNKEEKNGTRDRYG